MRKHEKSTAPPAAPHVPADRRPCRPGHLLPWQRAQFDLCLRKRQVPHPLFSISQFHRRQPLQAPRPEFEYPLSHRRQPGAGQRSAFPRLCSQSRGQKSPQQQVKPGLRPSVPPSRHHSGGPGRPQCPLYRREKALPAALRGSGEHLLARLQGAKTGGRHSAGRHAAGEKDLRQHRSALLPTQNRQRCGLLADRRRQFRQRSHPLVPPAPAVSLRSRA